MDGWGMPEIAIRKPDRIAYSLEEVAEATGLSRSLVYGLAAKGELPTCAVGRRKVVLAADLERFLDERRQSSDSESVGS